MDRKDPPNSKRHPGNRKVDLAKLRYDQDYNALSATKRQKEVKFAKPSKQDFIRVHEDPDYQLPTRLLDLKLNGGYYLVDDDLWDELEAELIPHLIVLGVNRNDDPFLWPIRLPQRDGDTWAESALVAAKTAMSQWVRVRADMSASEYRTTAALSKNLEPPVWPTKTFEELVQSAIRARYIDSVDHPVVRRLWGIE